MKTPLGILLIMAAFSLAIFSGCSNAATPVSTLSEGETPDFVKLPERLDKSVARVVSATKFIYAARGGTLELRDTYRAAPDSHLVTIHLKLDFKPNDLPYDDSVTVALDSELFLTNVNMTFGPDGIIFNHPVKLELDATGLTLDGVKKKLKLYYINGDVWQEMPKSSAHYDDHRGKLDAKGDLPHFSQYAFGRVTD